ncbi:MAG: hypothetical protein V3T09_05680 [bacterium]
MRELIAGLVPAVGLITAIAKKMTVIVKVMFISVIYIFITVIDN